MGTLFLLLGLVAGRKAAADTPPKAQSCSSKKGSSAIAVSIVFAECQGDLVLAAESLAQAAVSGCGDAYAAGIGVSVSKMVAVGDGGLDTVLTNAFAGATTLTKSVNDAAAVAQGLAIAFGSALPSELSASDLLSDIAESIANVAATQGPGGGCSRATALAIAFYNGLTIAASDAAATFAAKCGTQVKQCKQLVKLATLAASDGLKTDAKLAKLVGRLAAGGVGRGRCTQPLFSLGVDGQVQSSSLAITIANVTCPTVGNAQVAAIAIATAAQTDRTIASSAIAGVLTAGVDVTATFLQAATLAVPQRKLAVQAFAAAIVGLGPAAQSLLVTDIATALASIAATMGCSSAVDILGFIQGTSADVDPSTAVPAVSPAQLQQLCGSIAFCPASCTGVVGR